MSNVIELHSEKPADRAARDMGSLVLGRALVLLEEMKVPPRIVIERLLWIATSSMVSHIGKAKGREALETLILELDEGSFDHFVGRKSNAH